MGNAAKTQPNMAIQPMKSQAQTAPYGVIPGTMATPGVGAAPAGVRPPTAPMPQMPVSGAPQGPQGAPIAGMPPSGVAQQPLPPMGAPPVGAVPFNPGAPAGMQPLTPPNRSTIPPTVRYANALRGRTHV